MGRKPLHERREGIPETPKSQFELLNGKSFRLVPIKAHVLDGLQACIENHVTVRCLLSNGVLVEVKYKAQVINILKRVKLLRVFKTQQWSEQTWIETLPHHYLTMIQDKHKKLWTHRFTGHISA